jgi:hypothetical protein
MKQANGKKSRRWEGSLLGDEEDKKWREKLAAGQLESLTKL